MGSDMSIPSIEIEKLTPKERLQLVGQLWDSLCDDDIHLTKSQEEELDHRLDELDREGPRGIPWNEVCRRIEGRS